MTFEEMQEAFMEGCISLKEWTNYYNNMIKEESERIEKYDSERIPRKGL